MSSRRGQQGAADAEAARLSGRSIRIELLVVSIMLLVALGAVALVGGGWLASRELASKQLDEERAVLELESLAALGRTRNLWAEASLAAVDPGAGSGASETVASSYELAHEILNEVSRLTETDLFERNAEAFNEIVSAAGRVTTLVAATRSSAADASETQTRVRREADRAREALAAAEASTQRRLGDARTAVDALEQRIGNGLALSSAVYLLLALTAIRWMRRSVVIPIQDLTASARGLLAGQAESMVELSAAPAELRELSHTFATLTGRMRLAQRRAEAADQAKSRFLANVSHELRTPMTVIVGHSRELRGELDPRSVAEPHRVGLEAIYESGEHLLRILDDLLDLSRMEVGKLALERVEVSPVDALRDVATLMQRPARQAGLELRVEFPTPVPDRLLTDPTRLRQVLLNLVGNSIKFTPGGRVTLRARIPPGSSGAELDFEVEDTGIGMTREQIARIFEPFSQADISTSRLYGGTGLGLSICRGLAERLGGVLGVESEPGVGSRFRLRLPVELDKPVDLIEAPALVAPREAPAPEPRAEHEALAGQRILLAEDAAPLRVFFRALLERAGARVVPADNGIDAIELALAANERGEPFDAILMDMQMPVADGYEATRALRAFGYPGRIVALTAHAASEDRERCLRDGCDAVAVKPIDREALIALVSADRRRD
jgi:signal transduction histidine kinase/ActR/RegA family two-component response regulator